MLSLDRASLIDALLNRAERSPQRYKENYDFHIDYTHADTSTVILFLSCNMRWMASGVASRVKSPYEGSMLAKSLFLMRPTC